MIKCYIRRLFRRIQLLSLDKQFFTAYIPFGAYHRTVRIISWQSRQLQCCKSRVWALTHPNGDKIMTKKIVHYRDAGSGKYVKEGYAKKHPLTTVKETDKPTKPKNNKN